MEQQILKLDMNTYKQITQYFLMRLLCLIFNVGICHAFISKPKRSSSQMTFARRNKRTEELLWDIFDEEEATVKPISTSKESESDMFHPRTIRQQEYYDAIHDDELQLIIASGPAGTGKTLFPTQYAAQLLARPNTKIIVTRPLICVDEELGYLPGGINQKMDPWTIPIFDVLREFFTQEMLDRFVAEKRIEVVPLAFMRGRTFKNTLIIGDELQNTSVKQMLMLLTRLGENSKIVITGDVNQCDHTENGMLDFIGRLEKKYNRKQNPYFEEALMSDGMALVEMSAEDVQRSRLITTILDVYDKLE